MFLDPQPKPIEENGQPMPYTIVADDAFPLKNYNAIQPSRPDTGKANIQLQTE